MQSLEPDEISESPRANAPYIREHTIGSAIAAATQIATRNASSVLVPYMALSLPAAVFQAVARNSSQPSLFTGLSFMVTSFMAMFAYGVLVLTVSDICLGVRPSVRRALGMISRGRFGKLVGANLLQTLYIGIGFLLFIVPGIILALRYLFTQAAVIIENRTPSAALARSRDLAKGYGWRHLQLGLVCMAVIIPFFLLGGVMVGITTALGIGTTAVSVLVNLLATVPQAFFVVVLILFYYDLRVRKEAYSVDMLAEDLQG
jgi:hypothetical protein